MAVLNPSAPFCLTVDELETYRDRTGINRAISDALYQIREFHDLGTIAEADLDKWTSLDWARTVPASLSYLVAQQEPVNRDIGYGLLFHALKCGQELSPGSPERIMADQVTEILGTYLHKE